VTWPFDGIDVDATLGSSGWWLNIVLFVPLGVCIRGVLQHRRPRWSIGLVALTAYAVECGQAFTGFRRPDLADFVTNSVGGAVGCVLFAAAQAPATRMWHQTTGRSRWRFVVATTVALLLLLGTTGIVLVNAADRHRDQLRHELQTRYGDTTLETMHDVFFGSENDNSALERFMSESSVRPDYIKRTDDLVQVEVLYSDTVVGLHRCVFVTWTSDRVSFRVDAGDPCVDFRLPRPRRD
jgi:hypothetical protein